jgi:hypothetical protein
VIAAGERRRGDDQSHEAMSSAKSIETNAESYYAAKGALIDAVFAAWPSA